MKKITFIKLGGAVITNKEVPNELRSDVLERLVKEIAQAQKENPELQLLIGNGVGSFAHVPATKYKTMEGFINEESKLGMAITQDSAAQANRAVVKALLAEGIPAVTVAPSNSVVTRNKQAEAFFLSVLEHYLEQGLQPVVYGDVIADLQQGCTVWSTDTVFSFLARKLIEKGWMIQEIVHVTEASGVWQMKEGKPEINKAGEKVIFQTITPKMRKEVQGSMVSTKGFDVTGGMWHKIEESLKLAELGIPTRIMSGLVAGAVYKQLTGQVQFGTRIALVDHEEKTTYEHTTSTPRGDYHGWKSSVGTPA